MIFMTGPWGRGVDSDTMIRMQPPKDLVSKFKKRFADEPFIAQAPGRVNIIGEHTDYNEGFVLPAAINLRCWIAASPRKDTSLIFQSENMGDKVSRNIDGAQPLHDWSDYPVGVAAQLRESGAFGCGANLYIRGDVPLGAGMSSSAAIEVATAYALLHANGATLEPTAIAQLCQRAENVFVGANCGIMDQFAACHGEDGKALFLDCRSFEFKTVAVPEHIRLVVCNTMVKHELSGGEYNLRRRQCEQGLYALAGALPNVSALRDVTIAELERNRGLISDTVYRRCLHVISENERVKQMVAALETADTSTMSQLMADSHRSLRADFEVSCAELDVMVDIAREQKGVFGSRMMGGGFGGCTVNLVESNSVSKFEHDVSAAYHSATGIKPDIYVSLASEGAGIVAAESQKTAGSARP